MKIKTILFILILGFIINHDCSAQSNEFTLKIYTNSYLYNTRPVPWFDEIQPNDGISGFERFSLAANWKKANGKYMEVELSEITFRNKEYEDFDSEERRFGLTYEAGKFLGNVGEIEHLKYGIAGSAGLYYGDFLAFAHKPQDFDFKGAGAGLLMKLIPRLTYKIHDRILLDLNMPFEVIHIAWNYSRNLNPNLTIRQQEQGGFSFEMGNFQHVIRFGVGYIFK